MNKRLEDIRRFWQTESISYGESPTGAHSDPNIVALENEFVVRNLEKHPPSRLLDIGCGNGQRTRLFSECSREHTVGIDSSTNAIEFAKKIESDRLRFLVDDVLSPGWQDRYDFDSVVSCRCLINLGTLDNQLRVIDTVARRLPTGGLFVFCETCKNGTETLNILRAKLGLHAITPTAANLDLDDEPIMDFVRKRFRIVDHRRFGTYYFLTRCYYPAAIAPAAPDPKSQFNSAAAAIERAAMNPALEPYGRQLCVAARRL